MTALRSPSASIELSQPPRRLRGVSVWLADRSRIAALLVVGALGLGLVGTARADASVRIELRKKDGAAADGQVRLSHGTDVLTCTTQAGACVVSAREGGAYTVTVELPGAPSPKPKSVMIPPSGNVKLVVAVD